MIELLEKARHRLAWGADRPAAELRRAAGEALKEIEAALASVPAVAKLSRLGLEVIRDREGVDGFELQDIATQAGVLVPTEVDKPCGENCACVDYDDFPQTCYRLDEGVAALMRTTDKGDA